MQTKRARRRIDQTPKRPLRVVLATPPMTQLGTPYPATAYLTGFLRQHAAQHNVHVTQADPALQLFLRLFSQQGIAAALAVMATQPRRQQSPLVQHVLSYGDRYEHTVEPVIRFLQGRDPTLAARIVARTYLPEGPHFAAATDDLLEWAFGAIGSADRGKYLASLYIDDLAVALRDGVDPHFGLSRYGESLAAAAPTFDPLARALAAPPTLVDSYLADITRSLVHDKPDVVGLTIPFPGNVYGAFRMAQTIRAASPDTRIVLGGGYVNTELRELSDPRVFDYVDFITLDDGEAPLLALLAHLRTPSAPLLRTLIREQGRVIQRTSTALHDIPMRDAGTPTYDGLPLADYVSLLEMPNPVHRLWSDGRWNKLTLAHGCYWKQCSFCDVTLDYIGRYEPVAADRIVDRMTALIAETGQSGFHFVDEAAPPAGLRAVAERLLARQVSATFWGNIRFEKTFTPELCQLLANAGMVAVTGGLEVASDRLLAKMKKGVTVAQVARVTKAFSESGVLVHAYLMYGFPTQTQAETIDALELVRQLFAAGCLQSAFWHRFAATVHSPVGQDPTAFGIRLRRRAATFARNEVAFVDPMGTDHDALANGLRTAVYNYMLGQGIDEDVRFWFRGVRGVRRASVSPTFVQDALHAAS